MRIACVGGGPGGLYFATLMKRADPGTEITVFERNRPEDTFGFGVVFSDATLRGVESADPDLLDAIREHGRRWDTIEVLLKGRRFYAGGNGMTAITRATLLQLLQQRAIDAGVDVRFTTEVRSLEEVSDHDLVVACDGANSAIRSELAQEVGPAAVESVVKFIWFGTTYLFDGLTFVHEKGEHGNFAVHGYPISDTTSTFIVETDEASWRRAGLDEFDVSVPPGPSDEKSRQYLTRLFADQIDGAGLLVNNSRWANFRTRTLQKWHRGNVVFLGDAAHTAHFSVGSGTKMAMEDAAVLAGVLAAGPGDLDAALTAYEAAARPSVERIQQMSRPSLAWWENFGRYYDGLEPQQFAFHFMTRSIGKAKTAERDPGFVLAAEQDWAQRYGTPPLSTPIDVGGITLRRRDVSLTDGTDGLWLTDGLGGSLAARRVDDRPGPWAALVDAPTDEVQLPQAVSSAAAAVAGGASAVVVHGGSTVARLHLSETVRFDLGVPVAVAEPGADADRAETLVLSGRADLVVVSAPSGGSR